MAEKKLTEKNNLIKEVRKEIRQIDDINHRIYCVNAIMDLIYQEIKTGQSVDINKFYKVTEELKEQGAEIIILGCTELSLIKRNYPLEKGYIDTMEILAKRSVELCGATLKEAYQCLIQ